MHTYSCPSCVIHKPAMLRRFNSKPRRGHSSLVSGPPKRSETAPSNQHSPLTYLHYLLSYAYAMRCLAGSSVFGWCSTAVCAGVYGRVGKVIALIDGVTRCKVVLKSHFITTRVVYTYRRRLKFTRNAITKLEQKVHYYPLVILF